MCNNNILWTRLYVSTNNKEYNTVVGGRYLYMTMEYYSLSNDSNETNIPVCIIL